VPNGMSGTRFSRMMAFRVETFLCLICHPEACGVCGSKDLCNLSAASALPAGCIGPSSGKLRPPQDDNIFGFVELQAASLPTCVIETLKLASSATSYL
jgi:hypothetical protein